MAGLIGFDKSVFKTKEVIYSSTQDFNKITESGVYQIATTATIPNNPGINYGVLIVFTPSNGYTIQLAYSIDGTRKLFTRHGTNTWKESSF